MKTKIIGSYVVGYENGDHVIYQDGEVIYENDRIISVGRQTSTPVDKTIDVTGQLVSPGFIDLDALVDFDHGILDVAAGQQGGQPFRMDPARLRTREPLSRQDNQRRSRLSYAQLICNGITTGMPIAGDGLRAWAETYEEMADSAQIAREMGMRMYLGPSYRTYPSGAQRNVTDPRGPWSFAEAQRFIRDFEDADGLIRTFLSPCQILNLSEEVLRETFRLSETCAIPVRLHTGESRQELAYLKERYGKTPVEYLASIGALRPGTLLPHVLYTRPCLPDGPGAVDCESELRLLADSGVTVVHAPIAESHGGMALYSLSRYLDAGISMAFGTDTHPADMLQNMNFAWNLTRIFDSGEIVPKRAAWAYRTTAADVYRMATLGGANALGRQDLGRLCPGAKADIITVDLSGVRSVPVEDPIRTLVMNTTGADVTNVVIDGRCVLRDHVLPGVDWDALRPQAQSGFDKFRASYSWFDAQRTQADELFPPSFPLIGSESKKGGGRTEI